MGSAKDRQIEREETWDRVAAERGYRCEACGRVLTKDDYDTWGDCCIGCAPSLKPDYLGRD